MQMLQWWRRGDGKWVDLSPYAFKTDKSNCQKSVLLNIQTLSFSCFISLGVSQAIEFHDLKWQTPFAERKLWYRISEKNCSFIQFTNRNWNLCNKEQLKCIQNNDDRELLSFALTAVNILNKLIAVWAKLNSSQSSLF